MAESYADVGQTHNAPARDRTSAAPQARRKSRRRGERLEFYVLYASCFGIFLLAVIVRRALALGGIVEAPGGPKLSVIGEAREAVGSNIPYAFMG
jgi:hypothetical protein